MPRSWLGLVLVLLLGGSVYDPYSHQWVPCCAYSYGYGYGYGYPPPYYGPGPYGYPYGAPAGPEPQQGYPGAPASASAASGGLAQRFAVANVTHDGQLTREQAERGMPFVARNFDAIDIDHKGYVTLPEIRAFAAQRQ